ncbi:MAG: hypothetical protein RLZZ502_35 [Pseudomonadota bacterium]|jgi:tripartite-type tricarboxylate transporter receptor subunit TctC
MHRRHFLAANVLGLLPTWVAAQGKPLKLVVPFPPGGTSDALCRMLAAELQKTGLTVVVENKAGAGTVIGVDAVAKSAPDGFTLGCVANSFCVNQTLVKKLPYDGLKDLRPVALMGMTEHVLVTHPGSGIKSLDDLVRAAKAKPGALTYASFGCGTSPHLSTEMLKQKLGIDLTHVPYKGQAPAMSDVLGGQVTVMFGNWPEFKAHVASGKLVALGMGTLERSKSAPEIKTLAEQGLRLESNSWFGLLAPAGVSDEVVLKLNADINKAINHPAMSEQFQKMGIANLTGSVAMFKEFINAEISKYAEVIRVAGIKAE